MIYICISFIILAFIGFVLYLNKRNKGIVYDNPYLKYPRNKECYCGSLLKFKHCCLKIEPDAFLIKNGKQLKALSQANSNIKKIRGK